MLYIFKSIDLDVFNKIRLRLVCVHSLTLQGRYCIEQITNASLTRLRVQSTSSSPFKTPTSLYLVAIGTTPVG